MAGAGTPAALVGFLLADGFLPFGMAGAGTPATLVGFLVLVFGFAAFPVVAVMDLDVGPLELTVMGTSVSVPSRGDYGSSYRMRFFTRLPSETDSSSTLVRF